MGILRASAEGALKRAWFLASVAVGAWGQSPGSQAQTIIPGRPLTASSKIDEIRIVLASRLPPNPRRMPVDDYCSSYAVSGPKTLGGKLAMHSGWIVTSETKLGNFDAVTFVSGLDPSTSGTCAHLNGNLAIFDGHNLKVLAYERRRTTGKEYGNSLGVDTAAEDSLGSSEQINKRRIRLYYGLPSAPFADVVLSSGISIEQIAKQDPVCGGAAFVPNVFGQDIRKARKLLIANGWLPGRPTEEVDKFSKSIGPGVVELENCSGTGYGFCAFDYRHRKGFGLRIITAGEDYGVTSYSTYCGGRPSDRFRH